MPIKQFRVASSEKEKAKYESVLASLKVAKSNLKEAENRFKDTEVKSPMDGVIDEKKVTLHSLVNIGTPLFVISDHKEVKVVVPVPLKYSAYLQRGKPVTIKGTSDEKSVKAEISNILSHSQYAYQCD